MRNFEAHTDEIRQQMLDEINVKSIDSMFDMIPEKCYLEELKLDDPLSELEAQKELFKLSNKNKTNYISFLGGGAVKKFIPSAIQYVASRFEFLSAYTPYQPEISQGTLQIMYEFQSYICNLTKMDVANASVYDGGVACAEACLMAVRVNKIKRIFISDKLNPNYIEVIKTYLWAQDIEFVISNEAPKDVEFAGKIYAYPEYNGELKKLPEKEGKALIIASVDLSILPVVEPPIADIIVGDYQPFGLPLNFGGAYGGFIAVKDAYKRQIAGRIVGKTIDKEGKEAYVLTLQAREQHIRREKATGNICSNQALTALCCTLYLSLTGKNALIEYANLSYNLAHKLSEKLNSKGYITLNKNFFNSFEIKMKENETADSFIQKLKERNILAGIKTAENKVLVTVTEFNTNSDIKEYIETLN